MRISESYDRFKAFKSLYVPLTARSCEICTSMPMMTSGG